MALVVLDDDVVVLAEDDSKAVRSVVIAFSSAAVDVLSSELLVESVDEVDVVEDVLSLERSDKALDDELDDEAEPLGGGPPGGGPGGGAPMPEPDASSLPESDMVSDSPLDIWDRSAASPLATCELPVESIEDELDDVDDDVEIEALSDELVVPAVDAALL